ncbi:aromatic ring-hydroxylating oxygenase subunit alpha [Nocardia bovistercoris]|uniref:Aromatic ring-hydroxylating dioxygenase subunit alpha n=1 Tax=Nocardia bovistercoris TaxID=2785916 RepID=A0A931IG03_9NOCA|nr:aromatic ring-hydroxylating dioxygenase subunit alpha [Nocardia bovistercoris]MBH0780749.1 aromatic ring-hydroxylating dioxygenase subunit alpha [Nocardia bovistercoris]
MTETAENITESPAAQADPLSTPMTIGVEAYISPEYARAEGDRLWAKVWQQVCRVEEIPKVGDYLTYEIMADSIIVTRTAPDTIVAYHNVCAHRGRRLVDTPPGAHDARGTARQFVCRFHGWRYDLEGRNTFVAEREDWPCGLTERNDGLNHVNVDTWGGWVFVNMDPECESLREYLSPAADLLEHFELEKMRYRWRRWLTFDCNWKVAFEAFMETYHVPYTHPEFMNFGQFLGWARAQGKHSNIGYDAPKGMEENQAKVRLGAGPDARVSTAALQNFTWENANTNTTRTLVDVANRLVDELPEGTPAPEVLRYWLDTARSEDERRGVVWPKIDPAIVAQAGTAWQIFPNFQIGHALNNMLCYRFRPAGHDPDKCIFEAAVFELFPPGEEPETEWIYTPVGDPDWRTVLPQDFDNMAAVQQGMKSRGFSGPKPNPYRERTVVNLHHNLAKYMGTGDPHDLV